MNIDTLSQATISIVVGSKNPVKINAAQHAFSSIFKNANIKAIGIDAPSKVAEQPMSEQETYQGAINRVKFCQDTLADFYVAIEGGVDNFEYGPATFAFVVIANQNERHVGRSANLPLAPVIYDELLAGVELGDVMDKLFCTQNIKQRGGAMGLLTQDRVTREQVYEQALILALSPFINQRLYE